MVSDVASLSPSLDLSSPPFDPSTALISLTRLLSRLESTVLTPKSARALRNNPYQRTKVNANLEHARTLLLRLEHDSTSPGTSRSATSKPLASRVSSGMTFQPGRNNKTGPSRADLQQRRALIRQLQDALHHLDDSDNLEHTVVDSSIESDEDEEDADEEDILSRYAPAVASSSSINTDRGSGGPPLDPQKAAAAAAATMVASSLRSRTNATPAPTATASGRAQPTSAGPGQSLPTTVPFAPAPSKSPTSHAQLLESHDAEQDQLTSSLLNLASALKQSTTSFSQSILGSEGVVDQAAAALDKNVGGMEAASNRMAAGRAVGVVDGGAAAGRRGHAGEARGRVRGGRFVVGFGGFGVCLRLCVVVRSGEGGVWWGRVAEKGGVYLVCAVAGDGGDAGLDGGGGAVDPGLGGGALRGVVGGHGW
ncbi:hypothetical protein FH972_021845 [Carpinus fangiana]|uniref:t-SNARE coiled-coil homology domain-containing protein n=1 Tax=Carpinus fangiana TaxID=176857 RepID=A0A5N6KR20_9ROSI|nr:hypothetical protein FH972_021845 [Carpinus fangiana]